VIEARQFSLAAVLVGVALVVTVVVIVWLTGRGATPQRIAVPAYFYPGSGSYWTQLEHARTGIALAVMSPDSGPGTGPDPNYVRAVQSAEAAGITVLGYVYTSHGSRSAAAVESDINDYYSWYPDIGGIFFDQASTSCADQPYYAALTRFVKARSETARTVLNPGTQTNRCYEPVADILLTFEGPASEYVSSYSAPSWVARYPASHFWHVVYGAPTASVMASVVELSKQRRAGYVYVTSTSLPNPYDVLPTGRYWSDELAAIGASAISPGDGSSPRGRAGGLRAGGLSDRHR
jgi:Spherulation-specific family 4